MRSCAMLVWVLFLVAFATELELDFATSSARSLPPKDSNRTDSDLFVVCTYYFLKFKVTLFIIVNSNFNY